jgi:DNA invertase Pin-like site-specific DNA recombinase
MKAYSYIRISSKSQAQGSGLSRQLAKTEAYCEEKGLELDTSSLLEDVGLSGFSGKNAESGELGAFLEGVKSQKIKTPCYLICESLDRLSRQKPRTALKLFNEIVDQGVTLVTLMDGCKYSQESLDKHPHMLYTSLGVMQRAYDESKHKSDRALTAFEDVRTGKRKHRGIAPKWLEIDPASNEWGFNEKAEVVKRIVDLYLNQGKGTVSITNILNKEGAPRLGRSAAWSKATVRKVLLNPALYGTYIPKTQGQELQPIDDFYPTVISEEEHKKIKRLMEANKQNKGRRGDNQDSHNTFQSKVFCLRCDSPLHYRRSVAGGVWYKYLVCTGRTGHRGCDLPYIPYPAFEFEVIRTLIPELQKTGEDYSRDTVDKIEQLKFDIADLKEQEEWAADHVLSSSGALAVKARQKAERCSQEIKEKEALLDALEAERSTVMSYRDARLKYDELKQDRQQLRNLVLVFVDRIEVQDTDSSFVKLKNGHSYWLSYQIPFSNMSEDDVSQLDKPDVMDEESAKQRMIDELLNQISPYADVDGYSETETGIIVHTRDKGDVAYSFSSTLRC